MDKLLPPDMPTDHTTPDADLVLRVLDRHGLSQQTLAAITGYNPGQISRILGGQHAMPLAVYTALYGLTRDAELRDRFEGGDAANARADAALYAGAIDIQQRAHAVADRLLYVAQRGGMHRAQHTDLSSLGARAGELASALSSLAQRANSAAAQQRTGGAGARLPAQGVVA
jgi:transcriptional regulator with XRE-family HTH domain